MNTFVALFRGLRGRHGAPMALLLVVASLLLALIPSPR